nr:FAD-dependent oxidoreductase [Actinomycetota bacterium]
LSPGAEAALACRLSISAACDANELSAHLAAHTSSTFSRQESARVAGGNSRLADALVGTLPHSIRLRHPVARIRCDPSSVTLSGYGFDFFADAALITVPATVLNDIIFEPPLPDYKIGANSGVDYGHAAKLFVPLMGAAQPSAVMSVPDRFWCWTARGVDGSVQSVVSCFAGSAAALEDLDVANGTRVWLERLRAIRPDLPLDHEGAILATWDDDPWIRAAYSAALAGRPRDEKALAEPVGALYFAGEHTAGEWAGTMEGALRSGRRAAEQLTALA